MFLPSIWALLCLIFAWKGCIEFLPHDFQVGKTMPEFFWKQSFLKGFLSVWYPQWLQNRNLCWIFLVKTEVTRAGVYFLIYGHSFFCVACNEPGITNLYEWIKEDTYLQVLSLGAKINDAFQLDWCLLVWITRYIYIWCLILIEILKMYSQWIYNCIHVYVNRINGIETGKIWVHHLSRSEVLRANGCGTFLIWYTCF